MKKIIPFLFALMMCVSPIFAQKFQATNPQSKSIYYSVLNAEDKTVEVISNAMGNYTGTLTIPASVMFRGEMYNVAAIKGLTDDGKAGAFTDCKTLTEIVLPNTIKIIGKAAFMNTGLTKVTIPSSVDSIAPAAFQGCETLQEAILENKATKLAEDSFPEQVKIVYKED